MVSSLLSPLSVVVGLKRGRQCLEGDRRFIYVFTASCMPELRYMALLPQVILQKFSDFIIKAISSGAGS
jgi:hypothetical protein